jgi:hypothetical protein
MEILKGKWRCKHVAKIKMDLKTQYSAIMWTEVIWVRIRTNDGLLKYGNEHTGFCKI